MEDDTKKLVWKSVLISVCIVLGLWILTWIFVATNFTQWSESGTFGDSFGVVNALFTGLAFAGVIITVLLQRKELELQRKEVAKTTEQLEGQKEQFILQNETLSLQRFENTFFQLIKLHHDIVNKMYLFSTYDGNEWKGRNCFRHFNNELRRAFSKFNSVDSLDEITTSYFYVYSTNSENLDHYSRNLYNIVEFVDNSNIGIEKIYINLLRSQLSTYELVLLLYNVTSQLGKAKFKFLIEKHALLKNLDHKLLNVESHLLLCEKKAYGTNETLTKIWDNHWRASL